MIFLFIFDMKERYVCGFMSKHHSPTCLNCCGNSRWSGTMLQYLCANFIMIRLFSVCRKTFPQNKQCLSTDCCSTFFYLHILIISHKHFCHFFRCENTHTNTIAKKRRFIDMLECIFKVNMPSNHLSVFQWTTTFQVCDCFILLQEVETAGLLQS